MLDIITATRKCLKKQKVEVSEDNCVLGTFLIHFLIVILHVYSKQLRSVLGKFLRPYHFQMFWLLPFYHNALNLKFPDF